MEEDYTMIVAKNHAWLTLNRGFKEQWLFYKMS
jgi:hypothetical protein